MTIDNYSFPIDVQFIIRCNSFIFVFQCHLSLEFTSHHHDIFNLITSKLNFVISSTDRHHFDNPVYSTNFTNNPGAAGGGGPINGAVLGQVVFPLNNVACVNRVVNRFATNASSSNPPSTCKNTLNSDRERLRGFGGVEVRIPTAPIADGGEGLPNSRTYHDSFAHSSSMRRGNFYYHLRRVI